MRILCHLPDLDGGGAQRTLLNLATAFSAAGHEPLVVATRTNGPARAWLSDLVRLLDLGLSRERYALFPLARILRTEKPNVALATMAEANITLALSALLGRSKSSVVLRETNSLRARNDINAFSRLMMKVTYRRADRVVALSEGVRQELIEDFGLRPELVVTIHNPVQHDAIATQAAAARTRPPPVVKDCPWIVSIGRLHPQKGYDVLMRTLARVKEKKFRLVLLGEGHQRAELTQLATSLGLVKHILMPGFVSDPISWLAHADLFVLSSRWEGFGHAIIEAMAAGVPVVAFDCPHGPRDIIRDGDNGLLIPAGDEAALAAAMIRILSDTSLADRLAAAARRDIFRFSPARIADEYLSMFKALNLTSQESRKA